MNIFEQLSKDFNLEREVQNIWNIFCAHNMIVYPRENYYHGKKPHDHTIFEYVNKNCFYNWKSRGMSISCEEMMSRLEIEKIIIVEKNALANYAASTVDNNVSERIVKYNNILYIIHKNITQCTKNYQEYISNMSNYKLEKIYDDTYYLALLSLALLDNIDRNKRIDDLKKKIGGCTVS